MHRASWVALSLLALNASAGMVLGAENGHGGGIFEWALDLFIWTLIVFLLLLFILSKYAWKPMLEALRTREENIRLAAEEAKHARAETERVTAEFKVKMDQ